MNINELRNQYLPQRIRVLFVAEAVPDSPDRFFYYEKVAEKDWLYLYLMRALYGDMSVDYLRTNKAELLARFKADGFYLVDAVDDPITTKMSSDTRTEMVRTNASKKVAEIKNLLAEYGDSNARIVLVKQTVFDGLYEPLMNEGLPVANKSSIYFPSSGQQQKFLEQMRQTL